MGGVFGRVTLVYVCHDRPVYFRESLASLDRVRGLDKVDLIASMDDYSEIEGLQSVLAEFPHLKFTVVYNVMPWRGFRVPTDQITNHYRLILEYVFARDYDFAILVESDLILSPDFLEYMLGGAFLLDPIRNYNLFCISAWNDNGVHAVVLDPARAFRTDYFPGLGWMIHRSMWTEVLRHEWAPSVGNYNYDHWLRDTLSVKNLECVVPQVSRTHHIGDFGTHVRGKAQAWYDSMVLASGEIVVDHAEFERVASVERFEADLRDRLRCSVIATKQEVWDRVETSGGCGITVIVKYRGERDGLISVGEALTFFGLYSRGGFRGRHKGLLSFVESDGNLTVNLLLDEFRHYWGVGVVGDSHIYSSIPSPKWKSVWEGLMQFTAVEMRDQEAILGPEWGNSTVFCEETNATIDAYLQNFHSLSPNEFANCVGIVPAVDKHDRRRVTLVIRRIPYRYIARELCGFSINYPLMKI